METGPWVQMLRSPSDPPGHSACQSCRPLPQGEGEFSLFQRGGTVLRDRSGSLLGEGVSIQGPQPPCLLGVTSSFMWQAQAWRLCCQHLPAILPFETPWQPECSRTGMFRPTAGPQGTPGLGTQAGPGSETPGFSGLNDAGRWQHERGDVT